MTSRLPWTHDELQALIPKLDRKIVEIEEQHEGARPLPPMTAEECLEFFLRLLDVAHERPLTIPECFMHGQLLCCYRMAVMAEALGKKGRYIVLSEEDLALASGQ